MFTGIIEETGKIISVNRGVRSAVLRIGAKKILTDIKTGDSISVNGVCLTVTSCDPGGFSADVAPETLGVTNLGSLIAGSKVNLERALTFNDRLGGHLVSGHVDGTGEISAVIRLDNAIMVSIKTDENLMKYIIHKGSVAVDGISLTVAELKRDGFVVSVIPHTALDTTLASKKKGDRVNLECDMIGKYVEKFFNRENNSNDKGIGTAFLKEHGYL
ncbi:MAG: riboflavin synthase [Bacteroidetes bacterium]|nr:riboflavin synthase [Bacteroidota bacterium]